MICIYDKKRKEPKPLDSYFSYTVGNVYISDWLADSVLGNTEMGRVLLQSLKKFFHSDYGDISSFDADCNLENVCFGGELFGRYHTGDWQLPANIKGEILRIKRPDLVFKIRTYEGNTYVLADSEFDWVIKEEEKRYL